jgi:hypothetical protein
VYTYESEKVYIEIYAALFLTSTCGGAYNEEKKKVKAFPITVKMFCINIKLPTDTVHVL